MYLRLINVKAIERQRDSYILVINNRYEKMGESLYRINKDALEIIRNLNGTKTFDDLVDMMISCHLEKKEQAKYKLNNFLNELEKNPGISVEYLKKTNPIEIPILGNGKTQYPSAIYKKLHIGVMQSVCTVMENIVQRMHLKIIQRK